jgi:glycosyltransferase involved in cell wall biosynthesis
VARNYLAFAGQLAASFARHHPGARFVVLVVDHEPDQVAGAYPEMWGLSRLHEDPRELATMAGIYSVMEFATAVKPWLLETLLAEHDGAVVYLDPDCEVHAPLDDVVAPALDEGMVLTPHLLGPMPRDGKRPNEADILSAGVYNLGFLAVGNAAKTSGFLEFWRERLRRDAVVDPERMLFTDQRWVDFAPQFPHVICRDPGCNVAYWNVWGRRLERAADGGVLVEGVPLRFFHFSGFDPERPHLLSAHQGDHPRVRLPDNPVLAELCHDFARTLLDAGFAEARREPYGWGTTGQGLALTPSMRRAYRSAVVAAELAHTSLPPGPFDDDGGEAFARWLVAPAAADGVSHLLHGRWLLDRSLQVHFPHPLGDTAGAYAAWARSAHHPAIGPDELLEEASAYPEDVQVPPLVTAAPGPPLHGLNIHGYLDSELSLGQVARAVVRSAAEVGISFDLAVDRNAHGSHDHDEQRPTRSAWDHDVNVLCVNADQTPHAVHVLGRGAFERRRTAGLWFWEAPRFPDAAQEAFDLVDEVWAPSRYVADAVRAFGRAPRSVTLPVPVPTWTTNRSRADLGLPPGFLVVCTFDWMSVAERKNPLGALDAYTQAFDADDGASLVFKTMNGDLGWRDLDALRLAVADRPDVHVIDECVRSWEVTAMLQHCDCYLSLHRSEGFGLAIAEAMALGKPTIATAHSGNLDFMDADVAYLVPADLTPIPEHVPHYGGLGEWAEPDLAVAAELLRRVHDDPSGSAKVGMLAREHTARTRSLAVAGRSFAAAAAGLRATGGDRR